MDLFKQNNNNGESKPSVLGLMIEKHEAIEKTVSLIKQELDQDTIADLVPEKKCKSTTEETSEPAREEEFNGLTTLLEDSNIQSAIKVLAGNDTSDILDEALVALKSSETVDGKSKVFSEGIKKLHANLTQSDKSKLHKDPLFNLAIGLVGLRQNKRD